MRSSVKQLWILLVLVVLAGCKRSSPPEVMETTPTNARYVMSLSGTHQSATSVRRRNPFTGQDVDVHSLVVTDDEAHAAEQLLARYHAVDQGRGRYVVQLADGMRLEISIGSGDREGKWMLTFHAYLQTLGASAMHFLFDLAAAGGMIIDGDDVAIATSASTKERFPDAELVASPEDMKVLLQQGLRSWKALTTK